MNAHQLEESKRIVAQIIADTFDAPVQSITSLMNSSDRVVGTCIIGGNFYRFDTDNVFIEVELLPKQTKEIHDYTKGILDSLGVRIDSDRPYDWLMGFARFDAQVKCQSGGAPCGKKCLPKGQKCRISGGGAGLKSPGAKLKSPALGAITAGVAATALVAGTGVAAYRGRDEIKKGVDEAKDLVKENAKAMINPAIDRKKMAEENLKPLAAAKKAGYDLMKDEDVIKAAVDQGYPKEKAEKELNSPKGRKEVDEMRNMAKQEQKYANRSEKDIERIGKVGAVVVSAPKAAKKVAKGIGRGLKKGVTGKA